MHYWEKFGFFGGHVFLDFLNTYDDLGKTRNQDALADWDAVARWCSGVKILSDSEANALLKVTQIASEASELEQLHQLRHLGWRVFNRIAANETPDSADLALMNQVIKWSIQQAELQKNENGYAWVVQESRIDLTLIRVTIGLTLHDLLTSKNLDRISECLGCTGLFLNNGRGVGRRWCRMNTCGNRAKTNRFRDGGLS